MPKRRRWEANQDGDGRGHAATDPSQGVPGDPPGGIQAPPREPQRTEPGDVARGTGGGGTRLPRPMARDLAGGDATRDAGGGGTGEAAARRRAILQRLAASPGPVSGQQLAAAFGVTRTVIVHDIALLRAQGEPILATPAGYVLNRPAARHTWQVAVLHGPELETIRRELYAIVDQGVTVRDVIVEHPVYGELRGLLDLRSRHDVDRFCRQMEATRAEPLLTLTGGPHLHTLEADDPTARERVAAALRDLGFLLEDAPGPLCTKLIPPPNP
ncbi:3H domain-containing protein [Thermaerobacter litoralis]